MMKRIDFWLFGPELGCINRELPLIEKWQQQGASLRIFCHQEHVPYLQQQFPQLSIHAYRHSIRLIYKSDFDLDLLRSFTALIQFVGLRACSEYRFFRKQLAEKRPDFIITDFLPHIVFFANWKKIPVVGIYNYHLDHTDLGKGWFRKGLAWGTRKAYQIMYNRCRLMFLETLKSRKAYPQWISVNPLLRPIPTLDWSTLLSDENQAQTKIFLSLGGNFNEPAFLAKMNQVASEFPQCLFLLAPRHAQETAALQQYSHLHPIANVSPHALISHVDLVITKAGFKTVSEALAARTRLLLWDLPGHSEISETARYLAEQQITPSAISANASMETIQMAIQQALQYPQPKAVATNGVEQVYQILEQTF